MNPDKPIDIPPSLENGAAGTDLLATYWPSIIGLAIAVVLIGLWIWRARRDPERRTRRVRRGFLWWTPITIVLIGSLALGVNTWVGYLPSVSSVQRWLSDTPQKPHVVSNKKPVQGSGTTTLPTSERRVTTSTTGYSFLATIPSTAKDVPSSGAWVYLPPDYDKPGNDRRYPVIYAMHGSPGSAADWFAGGRIDVTLEELMKSGQFPHAIVVAPDLNAGPERRTTEPLNFPGGPQIEDYMVKDVVGWADKTLRTEPEAKKRIIAGMSSGGFTSLVFALRYPEEFGSAISLLPYAKPYSKGIVGNPEAMRINTPTHLLRELPRGTGQTFFIGQDDGESLRAAEIINRDLREHGLTTTLRTYPGLEHNWTAARTMMPYGLVWTAQQLGWDKPNG
ncbi:alpha/beta hydrolase [Mycetocola saprophilus]|uniref:alpha/beta hydrolase n=1 Tax=Mycetocola saprophilus TaxID=76636 RepID=UPI003BF0EFB7